MITAEFKTHCGEIVSFRVSGHSGYAESGSDIVCAAVSANVRFAVNLISETFGVENRLSVDDDNAVVDFSFTQGDPRAQGVANALYDELSALRDEYPGFVRVVRN